MERRGRSRFSFLRNASNKVLVRGGSEDTYVAGAAAVVVATLDASAKALAGDGVEGLLASLALAAREAGGEAERLVVDGIVAAFASISSSVSAAFEMHRRLGSTGYEAAGGQRRRASA